MTKNTNFKPISLDKPTDNDTFNQNIDELQHKFNSSKNSPNLLGSDSISGSTPSLESDDDVLRNAHQVGLAPDEDLENPQELNIAKDIDSAERLRKKL